MELKTLRKPAYTITIEGKPMRLRCDLNALDYLERSCGGLKAIGPSADIKTQKQLVRAFLLCNYPENAAALEAGELDALKPSLWQIGEWFDPETIGAVTAELLQIALESMEPPGGAGGDWSALEVLWTAELGRSLPDFWSSTPREILMRIDAYLALKTGRKKRRGGKEMTIGGKKYVRYETLADLQRDFPHADAQGRGFFGK